MSAAGLTYGLAVLPCNELQGSQLVQLVQLLPEAASEERVELCSCFWARLTDRAVAWSDVMRSLTLEQQVGRMWTQHCSLKMLVHVQIVCCQHEVGIMVAHACLACKASCHCRRACSTAVVNLVLAQPVGCPAG